MASHVAVLSGPLVVQVVVEGETAFNVLDKWRNWEITHSYSIPWSNVWSGVCQTKPQSFFKVYQVFLIPKLKQVKLNVKSVSKCEMKLPQAVPQLMLNHFKSCNSPVFSSVRIECTVTCKRAAHRTDFSSFNFFPLHHPFIKITIDNTESNNCHLNTKFFSPLDFCTD